ncbi:MAG TPA: ABC transporter permease subunit [Candidatus Binatia bacterium]
MALCSTARSSPRRFFSYPGIGDLLIQSISARDYRLTQVLILFFGVIYFAVNLLVDVIYTFIDPRIKL